MPTKETNTIKLSEELMGVLKNDISHTADKLTASNEKIGQRFRRVLRNLRCRMGWHSPSYMWVLVRHDGYHGVANEYKCPWCGYVGMVDSQGNLF